MEAFLVSTGIVALAEIGDKTQLLALVLAARFRRPMPIILGILVATIVNHGIAGYVGAWVSAHVGPDVMRWVLGLSFLAMAAWILVPDKIDAEKDEAPRFGVFGTTLIAFFLLEMGDKTQIATVALAARYPSLLAVVAGTTLGMMLANVPAVLLGDVAAKKLPLKLVHSIAAAIFAILGVLVLLGVGLPGSPPPSTRAAAPACNRVCLEKLIDTVMSGMTSHSAAAVPVTADFRYVENNQTLQAGTGSWLTLQSFGPYRHYFADPESGNAAVIATMRENDADGLFTLRIRVAGTRLAEAEAIITHDPRGAGNYARLGTVAEEWLQTVPAAERMTREQLAATANQYFGSMENNDGKGDYSFFADDCNRLEHGLKTTNNVPQNYGHSSNAEFVTLGCRGQFETGFLGFVTRIRDRRYEVIDVERGAVFSIAGFDHDGTIRNIALTSGKNFRIPPYFSASRTLQVGEAFRARAGKIKDIEMTLHEFPYGMPTAFRSTFDPANDVPGGQAPDPARNCDRGCLEQSIDRLLAAMVAHDPRQAPLADKLRYTENDQRLELSDGLWGTLTDAGAYRIRVVDPARGQAVLIARVTETDLPGILTLRARVAGGRISEIEAGIVREERPGAEELFRPRQPVEANPGALIRAEPLLTQLLPEPQRVARDRLTAQVDQYFDAVAQGKGGELAFAADCSRRENGVLVTRNDALPRAPAAASGPYALDCAGQLASGFTNYVQQIRNRRVLLVDEERGIVVAQAYYDIPGTVKSATDKDGSQYSLPAVLGRPQTLATLQLFKIDGGEIRRIEAVNKVLPYGARPAWPSP